MEETLKEILYFIKIVPNFDISMLWPKKWQQLEAKLFIGLKGKGKLFIG